MKRRRGGKRVMPKGACNVSHIWHKGSVSPPNPNRVHRVKHTGLLPWYCLVILPETLTTFGLEEVLRTKCRNSGMELNTRKVWNLANRCGDSIGEFCSGLAVAHIPGQEGDAIMELVPEYMYTGDEEYGSSGGQSGEGRCYDLRDEV